MRKVLLAALFVALPTLGARHRTPPAPPAVTVDTHADTPSDYMEHPVDLSMAQTHGHFDYARMKAGGLDAEFFAAYVPAKYANKGAARSSTLTYKVILPGHGP